MSSKKGDSGSSKGESGSFSSAPMPGSDGGHSITYTAPPSWCSSSGNVCVSGSVSGYVSPGSNGGASVNGGGAGLTIRFKWGWVKLKFKWLIARLI